MNTSTPENPGPKSHPSILLRGAPGSGKTTLVMQFPGVCILDCDENLKAPEEYIRTKVNPKLAYKFLRCRYQKDGITPISTDKLDELWLRYLECYNEMLMDKEVKTSVTDSLTGLDQMLVNYTMKLQNIQAIERMERQHWLPFRRTMQELSLRMRQSGRTNIVCAHETTRNDKKGEIIKYDVNLSSTLRENFGWVFTDIWYIEAQPPLAGKRRDSVLYTSPKDALRPDLKNSFQMPPEIPATWAELNKYLKLS